MAWSSVAWVVNPHGGQSKHARQFYDASRQKIVISGGDRDGSDAGQPNIYTFSPGNGTATKILDQNAAGKMPAYPDNCTWVHASAVDRYIIARSFWFRTAYAKTQQPARPDADWLDNNGIFDPTTNTYSATVIPTPASPYGWGGDSNCNFGQYSRARNALVRCYYDGAWGNTLQIIPLGDLVTFPTAIHYSVGSSYASGSFIRNYIRSIDAHAKQSAYDEQGDCVYFVGQSTTTQLPPGDTGWGLIKIDLRNPTAGERIALPADFRPQNTPAGGGTDYLLAFDPIRRELAFPQIVGYGGEVYSTLIYTLASGQWRTIASNGPPYPQGNVFCFAENIGQYILTGGKDTTSILRPGEPLPAPTSYFILDPESGVVPPPIVGEHIRATALTVPVNVDVSIQAGFYRHTVNAHGNPTILETVDTPNADIKVADYTTVFPVGAAFDFTAVLRTVGDTADIGSPITRTVTITGEDPSPPDPPAGDVTAPTIDCTFPAVDEVVSGTISPIFTVTDASGVLKTEVRISGVLLNGATFDTTTVPNGDTELRIDAWDNSTNQNQATLTRNVVVDNPAPPDPPDPTPTPTAVEAIFTFPMAEDPSRVVVILWAPVPEGYEFIYAGRKCHWSEATTEEVAAIEAGRVAEKVMSLERVGTDADMQAALLVESTTWTTRVASIATWVTLANAAFDGDAWTKR